MKLGIMQPYFFPYIGYFSLIKYTDEFIFFDTPQYISHGWVNRNRILKQGGIPSYITVPIKKTKQSTSIKDIFISSDIAWKEKIYGQLTFYRRIAPNYNFTVEFVKNILNKPHHYLASLNIDSIKSVCDYLKIERKFHVFSAMNLDLRNQVHAPDEWALQITKELKYDTYVNPPGGMKFFKKEKYKACNIRLEFLKSILPPYVQRIGHFESGLSIIDVMMFCSQNEILKMLNQIEVICE